MTLLKTEKIGRLSPVRDSVVDLVRQWGGSSSDAVLDSETRIFQTPLTEGIIGYRIKTGCAIAFGDPVSDPKNWERLSQEFSLFVQKQGLRLIFLGASKAFADIALDNVCSASIEFGEELSFDPEHDPRDWTGVHGSLVRRKVRHAIGEGVEIHEYTGSDLNLEKSLEEVALQWLESRSGPQIHISSARIFDNRKGKRWFYATQAHHVIAVVVVNQLKAKKGWLLNHLMMTPLAAHGTPEFLFVSVLEALKKEGCRYVTVGAVATQIGQINGLGSFSRWIAQAAFQLTKTFFQLGGRSKFWEKFHPQSTPTYLLFHSTKVGIYEILGILRSVQKES